MQLTVRLFARLREQLGVEHETIQIPDSVDTVATLRDWLAQRGHPWTLLDGSERVLSAVNETMASPGTPLRDGDEVAFFPPVTGG